MLNFTILWLSSGQICTKNTWLDFLTHLLLLLKTQSETLCITQLLSETPSENLIVSLKTPGAPQKQLENRLKNPICLKHDYYYIF